MRIQSLSCVFIVLTSLFCCTQKNRALSHAMHMADSNRVELEKVIEHYSISKNDSLKLKAAKFLIENLPGHYSLDTSILAHCRPLLSRYKSLIEYRRTNPTFSLMSNINKNWNDLKDSLNISPSNMTTKIPDILNIKSGFLIENIDNSFLAWHQSNFKDSIDFHQFCDYILPYRRYEGISIENWRRQLPLQRNPSPKDKSLTYKHVIDSILFLFKDYTHTFGIMPDYRYLKLTDFMITKRGECSTKCWFNSMVFASLGIPVSIDYVPVWANRNGAHQWNALIKKGRSYPFESFWELDQWKYKKLYNNISDDEQYGAFRLPKVFRYSYSINASSFGLQTDVENGDLPPSLSNYHYKDVSNEYFETSDIRVKLCKANDLKYAYLCVFNSGEWIPVEFAKTAEGVAVFKKMGRDIVYMPAFYNKGSVIPAGKPFYLDSQGCISVFAPISKRIDITISRKYPIAPIKSRWAESLIGAEIQGSNSPDFKNARKLHRIESIIPFVTNVVPLRTVKRYRYLRFHSMIRKLET